MKTVLATTYAINPYKGSEDGMGWNFVCQIAKNNKVIAITRENNQGAIDKYMAENPDESYQNITFLYFDLPYWMRFWKKGSRGAMLYYYLWQRGIVSFIIKQKVSFDIVHNLNFHNDWTPSFLWKLKKPMVWGPIGHHPVIPTQYLSPYSKKYVVKDKMTWLVKQLFWNYSWALRNTVKNASHIFCMNKGVAKVLNLEGKTISIMPSVATEDFMEGELKQVTEFNIISVGRFVPLKGFDLTIKSFAKFVTKLSKEDKSKCKLTLVGSGPEKQLYDLWINELGITENVEIIEWIERKKLMELYKQSSVFLFPSHEGAGMVVAEAMSFGLPVVCLANEGPGEFIDTDSGIAIAEADYSTTVAGLETALSTIFLDRTYLQTLSIGARKRYEEVFSWESRGNALKLVYDQIA